MADFEKPEDLFGSSDEFFKEMKKKFQNFKGGVPAVIIVIAVIAALFNGFYSVGPDEVGVIRRFGKYVRTTDPGLHLIKLALGKNIPVVPIPGPAALIAALSVSGLPGTNFIFYGWLSSKSSRRRRELGELRHEPRTIVFYESPHRLLSTLRDIKEIIGDRFLFIGRELTKKFEEVLRGKVSELIEVFEERSPKGEFTLILTGNREK